MSKTPPARRRIELLPPPAQTGKVKLISFWARTVGIPLIIGLQIVFLGIFALRAKLELDLRRLTASIAEKEAVVTEAQDFEQTFRRTQIKLDQIAKVQAELCVSCAMETLNKIKPAGIVFTTARLEGEKLELIAETPQGISFAAFVANILEEEGINEALLTSGSLNRGGNFVFTMELVLDKDKIR
ncbi:MAG: hypothetical protein WD940_00635 [Patescibacteria group bacterium]